VSRLFDPLDMGSLRLANRVVMAPMTRSRAGAGEVPTEQMAVYYAQRASAGLIVSEGAQISVEGRGYPATPGLHSPAQLAGWRRVTDAVHAAGGRIVAQLWHVGRCSHVSLQPGNQLPVAPSALPALGAMTFIDGRMVPTSAPRALAVDELPRVVDDFRRAARAAIDAGFDGVEVHGANGYLIEQFLRVSANRRDDAYGGSGERRIRFPVEVMQALVDEIGAGRVGLRLSPQSTLNGVTADVEDAATYALLMDALAPLRLAFVHVVEGSVDSGGQGPNGGAGFDFEALRARYRAGHPAGVWIVNNGYTRERALAVVSEGRADAVAFGKPFVANPDLVLRLWLGLPLAPVDGDTLYAGGERGYTDYPSLDFEKTSRT